MFYNTFYKKLNNTYIININYKLSKMTEVFTVVIIVIVIALVIIIGRKYFNTVNFSARVHPL